MHIIYCMYMMLSSNSLYNITYTTLYRVYEVRTICTLYKVCTLRVHNSHIIFTMQKLTFVTSPHISAALKAISPLTDNRHNRSTNICTVAARSIDCVDIAIGSVLSVAQWTWYVHVVSNSGQTGRTSGK